jgi:hypothetical protein
MGVEIGAGLSGGEPVPILYELRLHQRKIFVNKREFLVNGTRGLERKPVDNVEGVT